MIEKRQQYILERTKFLEKIAQEKGGRFIGPYKNNRTKCDWHCGKHLFSTTPGSIVSYKTWCPYCAKEKQSRLMSQVRAKMRGGESWAQIMHDKANEHGDTWIGPYIDAETKTEFICGKCNNHFWKEPHAYLRFQYSGCQLCGNKKGMKNRLESRLRNKGFSSNEEYMCSLADKNNGKFVGPYVGFDKETKWKCVQGHIFKTKPRYVYMDIWCNVCNTKGSSAAELAILDYIKSLGFENVLSRDKSIIGEEVDIYESKCKLAIEFDGLYWHSSGNINFKHKKSFNKAVKGIDLGLRYLMIYEDEWKNKSDLIKKMIAFRLGKIEQTTPTNVIIKKNLAEDEYKDFFDKHHLSGGNNVGYGETIGAYFNGKLIGAVHFIYNSKGSNITVLAGDLDYNLDYFCDKLLSILPRPIHVKTSNRLDEAYIYKNLGFKEMSSSTIPGYFVIDKNFRKRMVYREYDDLTTTSNLEGSSAVLFRIEDCGHKRWILE